VSAAASATMVGYHALLQRIVAAAFRGRVFGLHTTCAAGAVLVAAGIAVATDRSGAAPVLATAAFGTAILALTVGVVTIRVRAGLSELGAQLLFLENLNSFLMRFLYRFRRIGPSTVPRTGPVIVVANHRCSLDPWFLSAGAPYRQISFLIAAEYADWPIVRYYVRQTGCIPVRRQSRETRATKAAFRHLQAGGALGIFIEGGIVPPGQPPRPKDGAAVLALKTGATVIPANISGIRYREGLVAGIFTRHRARVRFGPAVDLSEFEGTGHDREMVHAATQKIYAAIEALAPNEPVGKEAETKSCA
jgi:1-acyl-sn-glycerol-3-phosphate acyltransferase